MHIQVEVREVYGCPKIYPVCPTAKIFAHLIGKKTISAQEIQIIKQLGTEVEVTSCPSVYSQLSEALCNQQSVA